MDNKYTPQEIEQRWYKNWEENGYFTANNPATESTDKPPYCIMIPPPNVTGSLHMGHAFQDTIMDALIRHKRMCGHNTLWQPGTDHAGIATQMVVERQLAADGQTRHDVGREKFIEKVWEWKEHSGGNITRQLRRMGSSLDWQKERFTMDDGLSDAVHEVFVKLYEEGLIYRGKRLVNWDPVLHTAVSDLEVISTEENGHLWHMRYPLADGSGELIVATTRPETMLGDSAVAVHPDDERYKNLIGKMVNLPLCGRQIPIIADDYVDQEFGTGCVKITPAHDFNDYAMGKRHDLELRNIFTIDAKVNDEAPEKYRGLDRYDARKQILKDLEELNLLEKIDDHKLMVPRGDRSHSVIEPLLTDQWFVSVESLAKPAIEAVEDGRIKFVPDNWKNTYFEWMRNIEDWCISRQIWWGHRIPAWYDEQGNIYVGKSEQEVREKHNLAADFPLSQDEDVLDTWFSSALWPFSTLGWPFSDNDNDSKELQQFYPNSVLVTGFDIIFFWVARMVMMGMKFMDAVPFHEIYIHGLVRDSHGQKMSKSKGNVLDPIDLIDGIELEPLVKKRITGLMQPEMAKKIEKQTRADFPNGIPAFGTDAIRFTFAIMASTGRDINFDLNRVEGYRNFCNKLWNASRFVLMNCEDKDCAVNDSDDYTLTTIDKWIISRLQQTEQSVNDSISKYRFDLAAQAIYDFTWNEYCDWYLELTKPILNSSQDEAVLRGTRRSLVRVLETLLRLAHPIIPYITEEIWQTVAPLAGIDTEQNKTIMLRPYPEANEDKINPEAESEVAWLVEFISGIRKIRSGMNITPSKPIQIILNYTGENDKNQRDMVEKHQQTLVDLAKLESLEWLTEGTTPPESATALVGELQILIPLAGLIDKEAELKRLNKELDKLNLEVERVEKKLANKKFVDKAPEAVVAKEQAKLQDAKSAQEQLLKQQKKINNL